MRYSIPVLVIFLCYHAVIGSDEGASGTKDEQLYRVRRGGLSMLRLGRGLQMLRLGKRGIPMLRLGRSTGTSIPDDLRFLLSNLLRDDRQVPLPRYGKSLPFEFWLENAIKSGEMDDLLENSGPAYGYYDLDGDTERQIRPAPRPGRLRRSASLDKTERSPPFPRFGKELSTEEEMENAMTGEGENRRIPPVMRYGKAEDQDESAEMKDDYEYDNDTVKRAMRMLRLGRGMRMLRLGKRPMDESEDYTDAEKRALRLLRLGKRPFKMLRLGRGGEDMDEEKRALRLLRLGRDSEKNESS